MNVAATANLIGITGITRRLVLDGVITDVAAREAMDGATQAKVPIQSWLLKKKLVSAADIAAANSI